MKVLICGAGIAGLTLALLLARARHDVSIVERSPSLRGGGYMIDFFGPGYDASERIGLLRQLEGIHYPIKRLIFLNERGQRKFCVSYASMRALFGGRHFNFMRGDLEGVLHVSLPPDVKVRYETTIEAIEQDRDRAVARLSDGSSDSYDLIVGADGVHSHVRELAFGPEARYSRQLGYRTAAYLVPSGAGISAPDDAFQVLTVPGRQAAVYPVDRGELAAFFLYAASTTTTSSQKSRAAELRAAFDGMDWIVGRLLDNCDPSAVYLDDVMQIEISNWYRGPIVLVGDACQCVSLLGGQGASLAVAGAYVLADELSRRDATIGEALARYQFRMQPQVKRSQRAGRKLAHWFLPSDRWHLALRDAVLRVVRWPMISSVVGRTFSAGRLP